MVASAMGATPLGAARRVAGSGERCLQDGGLSSARRPSPAGVPLDDQPLSRGQSVNADAQAGSRRRVYPSDTTEVEWQILAPPVPVGGARPGTGGRPVTYPRRDIVDAIGYVARTGCQWDALPVDFPPAALVKHYFTTWTRDGTLARIHTPCANRSAQSTAATPSIGGAGGLAVGTRRGDRRAGQPRLIRMAVWPLTGRRRSGLRRRCRRAGDLARWLGEALLHVQGEFERDEGAGGVDEIAGPAGEAGQHMVDHHRVDAGGGQLDGVLAFSGVLGQGAGALAGEPGVHGVLEDRAGEGGTVAAAHPVGLGHQR